MDGVTTGIGLCPAHYQEDVVFERLAAGEYASLSACERSSVLKKSEFHGEY